MAKKNIFIVGLDDFNKRFLEALPEAEECDFHAALDYSEIRDVKSFNMKELINKAIKRMESFEGNIDGVASYYDFPGTDLVPVLADHFSLPSPTLESVLKCEHKYWSRLEQRKAIPEHITEFQAFDPFDPYDDQVFEKIVLEPTYWIKPIKSFKSFMNFRIDNKQDFNEAIIKIRERAGFFCEPFTYFIDRYAQLPPEVSDLSNICLAEYPMGGFQVTLEGHCFQREVVAYGIVDSIREKDGTSFGRYQYPSNLPLEIQQKMMDIARKIILHIELNNSPFNIEFFYDQRKDQIYLLEINPRVSEAHTEIFSKVHGHSHFSIMVDLCLGRNPPIMEKKGSYNVAAHFMVRHFEDGVVVSVPSKDDIRRVEVMFPETEIKILVKEGDRLSELVSVQSSYSFELANIFVGGRDEKDMLEKYQSILDMLPIRIENPE